jgi:hypothetical protein
MGIFLELLTCVSAETCRSVICAAVGINTVD